MSNVEPDAGELLVKALDLAVGASALARYAAEHTADARLRRLFRQFATTSAHQERALRRQLARTAAEATPPASAREVATYLGVGLAAVAALGAGVFIFSRLRGAAGAGGASGSPADTAAGFSPGGLFGGPDGALGAGRGTASPRGTGF